MSGVSNAESLLGWARRIAEDTCHASGYTFDEEAIEAFNRVWGPACRRFEADGRFGARFRANRAVMEFQIRGAGEAIALGARLRGKTAIEGAEVLDGTDAFGIMKMGTPYCPSAADVAAARAT